MIILRTAQPSRQPKIHWNTFF